MSHPRRYRGALAWSGHPAARPVAAAAAALLTVALSSVPAPAQMVQLGSVHTFWGQPSDLVLQQHEGNTYAYVSLNESDTPVVQFDVTEPGPPIYLGYLEAPTWTCSLELFEDRLYVPGAGGEVAVFDLSDPLSVQRVGTINNGLYTRIGEILIQRVAADTVLAYLEDGQAIDVWDVTTLGGEFRITRLPHAPGWSMLSAHATARYVYASGESLRVYQTLPADSIRQVSSQVTGNSRDKMFALHPTQAVGYLPTDAGVRVYDVSDPRTPVPLDEFIPHGAEPDPIPGRLGDYICADVSDDGCALYLSGCLGYEPLCEGGDYPIDGPLPAGYEPIFYAPYWGQVRAGRVLGDALTQKGGVQILDLTDPAHPAQRGCWVDGEKPTYMIRLVSEGDLVCTADCLYGLRIFDATDADSLMLRGGYHCSGHGVRAHVLGDHVYLAQNLGGSVVAVDVSDKLAPTVVSKYDTGLELWDLWSDGQNHLYYHGTRGLQPSHPHPTMGHRLHVLDVSDPAAPFRENVCIPESDCQGIREGKYVYSAQGAIYDLTNPGHPIVVGSMHGEEGGTAGSVDKVGQYVYMYQGEGSQPKFLVIDVSDIHEGAPSVVGETSVPYGYGMMAAVVDRRPGVNRAYIALKSYGIGVVDISDPLQPAFLGCVSEDAGGQPIEPVEDIFCQGDRMWTTCYDANGSLTEYDISGGMGSPALVQRIPNIYYTWRTVFADGYAYRVNINGLDIVGVPESVIPDTVAPSPVLDLAASWHHDRVDLSWSNPARVDRVSTKIVRRADRFPEGPADGDLVYDGSAGTCADTRIVGQTTYHYAAFAYDAFQNYSGVAESSRDTAFVADPVPPGEVSNFRAVGLSGRAWLRWALPDDADVAGTRVVRREGSYPETPEDGAIAFEGAGEECWDEGVDDGCLYFYSAFAYDQCGNLGPVDDGGRDFVRPGPVVFQDDLEDEPLGSIPSRWDVRSAGDSLNTCRVWSDSLLPFFGTEHPLRSQVLGGYYCGNLGVPGAWGWFIRALPPCDSCTIHFDMMDPEAATRGPGWGYVWFSWQDDASHNHLQLAPNYYQLAALEQIVDGTVYRMQFNPSLPVGPHADWFSVRVHVAPESLAMYVEGDLVLSLSGDVITAVQNGTPGQYQWPTHYESPAGGIALGAHMGVYFDNIVVTATSASAVPDHDGTDARRLALYPNTPNPFSPLTHVGYDLPCVSRVTLRVYDVAGRLVRELVDAEVREPGIHSVTWDGRDAAGHSVAAGVYLCRLEAAGEALTRKMVLLR